MLEGIVDPRHFSELHRALEVAHQPQLLEVRDVPKIPQDRAQERIVLDDEVLVAHRLDEQQCTRARLLELRGDTVAQLHGIRRLSRQGWRSSHSAK